eukprot:PLAT6331.1.p1 GENE.PLAT6331.1~~PLAT6331.1.p1  ORF type:complete len:428 (+),score=216.89 PLAT6331.1:152-1285(+)
MGAGSFTLPYAVAQGGFGIGVIGIVLLGLLSTYTINQLAEAELQYRREHPALPPLSFPQLGERLLGKNWGRAIYVSVVLTILGVCGVYLDVIGVLISRITPLTEVQVQLLTLLPVVLLSWLRDLRYLSYTSLLGDIAVAGGLFVVLYYGALSSDVTSPADLPFFKPRTVSTFFGETVFLFTVHAIILPVMQSMKTPQSFRAVSNASFAFAISVNAVFAGLGYMFFASRTNPLVIDNIPDHDVLGTVVKGVLVADLFFTIPIVLTAPRELVELSLFSNAKRGMALEWKRNGVRTALVAVFYLLALLVPFIQDLASLVGSVVSPFLGFIVPPLLYVTQNSRKVTAFDRCMQYSIIAFGVLSGIFATTSEIIKLYHKYSK